MIFFILLTVSSGNKKANVITVQTRKRQLPNEVTASPAVKRNPDTAKTIENYFQFSNQTFFKDRLLVDTFFRKQSSDVKHARTLMSLDTTPTTEQNRFLAVLVEAISQYKI